MNPDSAQVYALAHPDKAYIGDAPTLKVVNEAFGKDTAETWLVGQIANLNEFCGCKDKLSEWQLESLARMLVVMFPYMKVSEYLLFFARFKMGWYGQFYGNVDPMVITRAIHVANKQRNDAMARIENEQNAKRDAEEAKKPHYTYDEWQVIKQQRKAK